MSVEDPDAFAGSPATDPAWRSITLGEFTFPPSAGKESFIEVEVDEGIKVDQQKASGKDKAKTKVNGIEVTKAKVTVWFTDRIWNEAMLFLLGISPNGEKGGEPLDAVYPQLNDRSVTQVLVTKMGKLERLGPRAFKQSFDLEEWVDPGTADAAGEGTKTPERANPWYDSTSNGGKPPGAPPAKGFDGPSAPSAAWTGQKGKA